MRANGSTTRKQAGAALRGRAGRTIPFIPLLIDYAALVAAAVLLMRVLPDTRHAIAAPIAAGAGSFEEVVSGTTPQPATPWSGELGRLELTSIAALGALLLALPVAWIHMFTRRLRYDPSLVQSIIILPIVVAGVVLVVKNSLALAFALAGIVAGVRFRQKLNEPQEAVYVLLALGIGLAAGVQALDVAIAMSLIFNLVVLAMWRYDFGSIYARGGQAVLATGDTRLAVSRSPEERERIRARAAAPGIDADGVLVLHAVDADAARHALEVALAPAAKEWRLLDPVRAENGLARIDVLVRFREDEDPVALLGQLEERWAAQIAAAEYVPHRVRTTGEDDDEE